MAEIKHETKNIEVSKLKEFPTNPNIHNKHQIAAMAESIKRYGQYYPIICDEDLTILAGHGKKRGLQEAGLEKAKVTIITGLTPTQKKKLVLEDNKIQNMSYLDFDVVEDMLRDIGDMDIIGFNEEYLDALIGETTGVDNMGVNLTEEEDATEAVSKDKEAKQQSAIDLIETGAEGVNTIKCPHCQKTINL